MLDREVNQMSNMMFGSVNAALKVADTGVKVVDEITKILDALLDNALRYGLEKDLIKLLQKEIDEDRRENINPCRVICKDDHEAALLMGRARAEGVTCFVTHMINEQGEFPCLVYSGRYKTTMDKLLRNSELVFTNSPLKDIYEEAKRNGSELICINGVSSTEAIVYSKILDAKGIHYGFSSETYPANLVLTDSNIDELKEIRTMVAHTYAGATGKIIRDAIELEEKNYQSVCENLINLTEFKDKDFKNAGYIVVDFAGKPIAKIDEKSVILDDGTGEPKRLSNLKNEQNRETLKGFLGKNLNNGLIPLTTKEYEEYQKCISENKLEEADKYIKDKAYERRAAKEYTKEEITSIEKRVYELKEHYGWKELAYDYSFSGGIAAQMSQSTEQDAKPDQDYEVDSEIEEEIEEYTSEHPIDYKEANLELFEVEERIFRERNFEHGEQNGNENFQYEEHERD